MNIYKITLIKSDWPIFVIAETPIDAAAKLMDLKQEKVDIQSISRINTGQSIVLT